ncbi:MAG TPA: hypothetical protein VGN72_20970 [Tepidisphaeraceae bacterium]|jgi:hypothetical protein|nr:hypothetical protein [Tepidisphaeraceae bacterium]
MGWSIVWWLLNSIEAFAWHVAPVVTGVVLGGILVQRYWVRKSNEASLIQYLTDQIHRLVDETLEYWSIDCSKGVTGVAENRIEAKKLAQKVKSTSQNLNGALSMYSAKYAAKKSPEYIQLMADLHDACTNGNFEVEIRGADYHRFLHVVNAAHKLRFELNNRKL